MHLLEHYLIMVLHIVFYIPEHDFSPGLAELIVIFQGETKEFNK